MTTALLTWQYRISRFLGRLAMRVAALLTRERMPPFVSTSAIVREGERILVVVDPIRHEPILPGGHLKWRETPPEAVVREVREETGYDIVPRRLVGVFAGQEWADEPGVVRLVYEADLAGGSLRSSPEGEAKWVVCEWLATSDTRDAEILRGWRDQRDLVNG